MSATFTKLISADEFQSMPGGDRPRELVRGRIVELDFGVLRHGQVCAKTVSLIGRYLDEENTGHLLCNDVGFQTQHNPDTVRRMDVAFLSYSRYPKGPLPDEMMPAAPNLVLEVASPSDPWSRLILKSAEYLEAGVDVVCVLDPVHEVISVFRPDTPPQCLQSDDEFHVGDVLPGFHALVRRFFE